MRLADKINQLSLIKTKFADLGDHSLDVVKALQSENEIVDHYRKLFKDSAKFDKLFDLNEEIKSLLIEYYDASTEVKKQIATVVHARERNILQDDHKRYHTEPVDQALLDQRNDNIDPEFVKLLKNVIQRNSDWRFAGCVINPIDEQFVQDMVACEPLYVISNNDVSINRIKEKMNNFYFYNRLRFYDSIEIDLSSLNDKAPNHPKPGPFSVGFSICVNHFEYIPLDEQGDILSQIYNITSPGGQMLITYNDCDQRKSLEHTLEGHRFYNTKELLLGKAYSIGWNIIHTETIDGLWQYAILQKEGELYSIKTSAPMVENMK